MKPRLLDLFCCQGGAARGYEQAGFDVYGVDIDPQPRYPYPMHQGDALEVLDALLWGQTVRFGDVALDLSDFEAMHASPPCQAYTLCQRIQGNVHPDLVEPTRAMLDGTGLPYIIENVEGAPLLDPVLLCGAMFPELRVYRHRLFEANFVLDVPAHPEHVAPLRKMGRAPQPGDWMHVVGNFSGVAQAREAMGGVDWMTRDGLRESIPPAYTAYLGAQLIAATQERASAA